MARMHVLVTGDSGLLGGVLMTRLSAAGLRVHGCSRSSREHALDLTDPSAVTALLDRLRPDVILHAAALADVDACERDPAAAWQANVAVTRHLCAGPARLLFISTDQVYDGPGPHSEADAAAHNVYAGSKLAAENAVLAAGGICLRTNFFGPGNCGRASFSDRMCQILREGTPCTLFTDVLFSPLHMHSLCDAIIHAMQFWQPGCYNCGSHDGMSKRDFVHALARHFGLDIEQCRDGCRSDVPLQAYRPGDMRMDVSVFERTFDMALPSLVEQIHLL